MDIPVKFSKGYHGNVKDFLKKTNDYEYVITFNERKKRITVNICKDGERYVPDSKTNYIGIDVNIKHNLFSLSNGDTFDYNRKLVNDYSKLSSKIDNLKKNEEYKIGKRKQWKLDKLSLKMKKSNEQLISSMCKRLESQGIDHIVMENLDNGFGKSYVKDGSNEDINFNRVVKFLNISSLKQMVEHIGRNYDIALSTVHSSYTSKMCPVCGCIEDENRPSQEEFSCINCGHEDNADHNAAVNIENRVSEAVLRNKLLKQLDNGAFEPKKLKREKVKEVLLSYRTNLVRDREPNFS
jgi:putative transposase